MTENKVFNLKQKYIEFVRLPLDIFTLLEGTFAIISWEVKLYIITNGVIFSDKRVHNALFLLSIMLT